MIKSNMRCIETQNTVFVICFVASIKSNMRCIETTPLNHPVSDSHDKE